MLQKKFISDERANRNDFDELGVCNFSHQIETLKEQFGTGTYAVKIDGASAVAVGSIVVFQKKGMKVLLSFPDAQLFNQALCAN